jgi:hypothetical protein
VQALDANRLLELLEEHDYVQHRVAKALGISYATLDRRLKELGVNRATDLTDAAVAAARERTGGDVEKMARLLRVSVRGLRLRLAGGGGKEPERGRGLSAGWSMNNPSGEQRGFVATTRGNMTSRRTGTRLAQGRDDARGPAVGADLSHDNAAPHEPIVLFRGADRGA